MSSPRLFDEHTLLKTAKFTARHLLKNHIDFTDKTQIINNLKANATPEYIYLIISEVKQKIREKERKMADVYDDLIDVRMTDLTIRDKINRVTKKLVEKYVKNGNTLDPSDCVVLGEDAALENKLAEEYLKHAKELMNYKEVKYGLEELMLMKPIEKPDGTRITL